MQLNSPFQPLWGDLRKGFALCCLLIVSWSIGSAQNFQSGVQGGLAVTHLRFLTGVNSGLYGWDPAISGGINFHLGFGLGEKFKLFVEPGLIQKSGRFASGPSGQTQFLFVQLPILLNFSLGEKFNISAGPELGTPLRAVSRQDGQTRKLKDVPSIQVNQLELSGVLGVSYALGDAWDLGLRYNRGISPVYQADLSTTNSLGEELPDNFFKAYTQYAQLFLRWKW